MKIKRDISQITEWNAVDDYISNLLIGDDIVLDEVLRKNSAAGLPPMNISPTQGKLLQLLVQMHKAKHVLEIGTLGAYSTIWLARGLPTDGKLITLEMNPHFVQIAESNIAEVGLSEKVEVRLGDALDSLSKLSKEKFSLFDFVFIDADKQNYPHYFEWSLKLVRPGAVIIIDNVIRNGAVIDEASDSPSIIGIRKLNELIAKESRVSATEIQTVGSKGYDGFAIILVLE